jgi:hypothetical protein
MRKEELIEELRRLSAEDRREILIGFSDETGKAKPPQVFLSYSRNDIPFVHDLMAGLERGGVRVWFDVRELAVGEDYLAATERGLQETDYCLVVVSRFSMESREVTRELDIARSAGTPILPVILSDATITEQIRNLQWIDFRVQFDAPLTALIARLQGRHDGELTAQRLRSATKPLKGSGLIPLIHQPPSMRWFSACLMAAGFGVYGAGVVYVDLVPLWVGVNALLAIYIYFASFSIMNRKVTLGEVRTILWCLVISMLPWLLAPATFLDPPLRHKVWSFSAFSLLSIAGAILIAEFSASFRRVLPARSKPAPVAPAWLKWRKRASTPSTLS